MISPLATTLAAIICAWPVAWRPPGDNPETAAEHHARREMAAHVIAAEAEGPHALMQPYDSAALVATVWRFESGWLEYNVHAGLKSHLGPQGGGLAKCLGQIEWTESWIPFELWTQLAGTARYNTELCAYYTLDALWIHARRCLGKAPEQDLLDPLSVDEAAQLFAAYGAGRCVAAQPRHRVRANTWASIRTELMAAVAAEASR